MPLRLLGRNKRRGNYNKFTRIIQSRRRNMVKQQEYEMESTTITNDGNDAATNKLIIMRMERNMKCNILNHHHHQHHLIIMQKHSQG